MGYRRHRFHRHNFSEPQRLYSHGLQSKSTAAHRRCRQSLYSFLPVRPLPAADLRAVDSVLVGIATAGNLAIAEFLFGMRANSLQFRDAVDSIDGETEPVCLVADRQLHRCVNVPLLLVTAYVQVPMVRAAVR